MPYNALGDLYKIEVVKRLQKMGCNVKSVHALNLILENSGTKLSIVNKRTNDELLNWLHHSHRSFP